MFVILGVILGGGVTFLIIQYKSINKKVEIIINTIVIMLLMIAGIILSYVEITN